MAQTAIAPWLLLLICLVAVALRVSAIGTEYIHPDEVIATGVVSGVLETGSLDTNWQLHDVERFKYNSYNFSSHLLFLSALNAPVYWITGETPSLELLRAENIPALVLVIVLTYALAARFAGPIAGLTAAVLVAASPQLFQDSLYARSELWFAAGFLGALCILVLPKKLTLTHLGAASALTGLLIACKMSAGILAPMPLMIYALRESPLVWRSFLTMSGASLIFGLLGTFVGMPYALFHPMEYWAGVQDLMAFYSGGGDGPHGIRDGTFLERDFYLADFLVSTIGLATLALALYGLVRAVRQRHDQLVIIAAFAFISIGYLGTQPLFLERNFSHALPVVFAIAGLGTADLLSRAPNRYRLAGTFAVIIALAAVPAAITYAIRFEVLTGAYAKSVVTTRQAARATTGLPVVIWPNLVYGKDPYSELRDYLSKQSFPLLIEFTHYDDRYGERVLATFLANYQTSLVTTLDSPFKGIPPSGPQTYLASSRRFYRVDGLSCTVAPALSASTM